MLLECESIMLIEFIECFVPMFYVVLPDYSVSFTERQVLS